MCVFLGTQGLQASWKNAQRSKPVPMVHQRLAGRLKWPNSPHHWQQIFNNARDCWEKANQALQSSSHGQDSTPPRAGHTAAATGGRALKGTHTPRDPSSGDTHHGVHSVAMQRSGQSLTVWEAWSHVETVSGGRAWWAVIITGDWPSLGVKVFRWESRLTRVTWDKAAHPCCGILSSSPKLTVPQNKPGHSPAL